MARTLLEAVLRRAILQGGSIGYNPDMYDYGFADNIPPSEEFNNKLRQYGHFGTLVIVICLAVIHGHHSQSMIVAGNT